jgi:NAD(P)-dependent dehydrogenase (short-subunit alcohol dehydrogenase family)
MSFVDPFPRLLAPSTVNNVGVSHEIPADFVDTSPEELDSIINVNVTASLRITSLIAPSMVSRCVTRPLHFILRQAFLDAPRSCTDFTARRV